MNAFIEIADEEVDDLLRPEPVTWHDKEMRCASKGCGSPTYHKLRGVPYCMIHTIHRMNDIIKEYEKNAERS